MELDDFVRWLKNSIKYHLYGIAVALIVLGMIYLAKRVKRR